MGAILLTYLTQAANTVIQFLASHPVVATVFVGASMFTLGIGLFRKNGPDIKVKLTPRIWVPDTDTQDMNTSRRWLRRTSEPPLNHFEVIEMAIRNVGRLPSTMDEPVLILTTWRWKPFLWSLHGPLRWDGSTVTVVRPFVLLDFRPFGPHRHVETIRPRTVSWAGDDSPHDQPRQRRLDAKSGNVIVLFDVWPDLLRCGWLFGRFTRVTGHVKSPDGLHKTKSWSFSNRAFTMRRGIHLIEPLSVMFREVYRLRVAQIEKGGRDLPKVDGTRVLEQVAMTMAEFKKQPDCASFVSEWEKIARLQRQPEWLQVMGHAAYKSLLPYTNFGTFGRGNKKNVLGPWMSIEVRKRTEKIRLDPESGRTEKWATWQMSAERDVQVGSRGGVTNRIVRVDRGETMPPTQNPNQGL